MVTRSEDRFGQVSSLGSTYTSLGIVATGNKWNLLLHIANRTGGTVKLRAGIADTSWDASGEPTGGELKAAIAWDAPIGAYDVVQISGIILESTEELFVWADTASSLDITAQGVEIAP